MDVGRWVMGVGVLGRLHKCLELIALLLEPFDGAGQGRMEFVDALQRVVESDDATVAGIATNVLVDVVGSEPFRVVACDEIPHHNPELLRQPIVHAVAQPAVRGTE